MSYIVPLRPAAINAWLELQDRLAAIGNVPCTDRPEWTSDEPDEREYAAAHCARCPLLDPCQTFAVTAGEPWGVWAGQDRTPTKGRPGDQSTLSLFEQETAS